MFFLIPSLRANQNAKRLHGAFRLRSDAQSRPCERYPILHNYESSSMSQKTKKISPKPKARPSTKSGPPVSIKMGKGKGSAPKLSHSRDGSIRVSHREYLVDIISPSVFDVGIISVNPGLTASFPFLSRIALLYESYIVHSLTFHFVSSCSTATAGSLLLAFDPNSSDTRGTVTSVNTSLDKQSLLNFRHSRRSNVWDSFSLTLKSSDLETLSKRHFIRTSTVFQGEEPQYDVGDLIYSATNTSTAGSFLGEIHVSYDISLFDPNFVHDRVASSCYGLVRAGGGTVSKVNYLFGNTPAYYGGINLRVAPSTVDNSTVVYFYTPGTYYCTLVIHNTGAIPVAASPIYAVNTAAGDNIWAFGALLSTLVPGSINAANSSYIITFYYKAGSSLSYLTIDPVNILPANDAILTSSLRVCLAIRE